jgi:hypothetical protein
MDDATPTLTYAERYVSAGLSVIPIKPDASKAPALDWTEFQRRRPTRLEISRWFTGGYYGLAVIGGRVSGNLLVIDVETEPAFYQWHDRLTPDLKVIVDKSPLVATPKGGRHVWLRLPFAAPHNLKLARSEENNTVIETRGEGGYVLAPGSPSKCHERNIRYSFIREGWLS